jgi:hypothetical protein
VYLFDFVRQSARSGAGRNGIAYGRNRRNGVHLLYAEPQEFGKEFVFVSELSMVRVERSADFGIVKANGMLYFKIFHFICSLF